jgi:hypothetical protein
VAPRSAVALVPDGLRCAADCDWCAENLADAIRLMRTDAHARVVTVPLADLGGHP